MAERDLINAFNDCLYRIEQGETIDSCIAIYPNYAVRLRPLLETTELVKQARIDSMEILYVQDRMRARVSDAVRNKIRPRRSSTQRLNRIAALLTLLMLICLLAGIFILRNEPPMVVPIETITVTETNTLTASVTLTSSPTENPSPTVTLSSTVTPTNSPTYTIAITPTPSLTPTLTNTSTPDDLSNKPTATLLLNTCTVTPNGAFNVRIRSGNSTLFRAIDELSEGSFREVVGFNTANGGWYAVQTDDDRIGWVANSVVETNGDCADLQLLTAPPSSTIVSPTDGGSASNSNTNNNTNNDNDNNNDNDDDDDNDNDNSGGNSGSGSNDNDDDD